ncbi:hypothetical protein HUJ05_007693 [Dendroctonus ponderosae]|nr:hypothetical protein HUJ05_007693 [Dendroctonus ponderosae]
MPPKHCLPYLYRGYLEDRPFLVRTDSKALTWLGKFKDTRAKLTRWALMLQEYSFTLEHVPGKHNELPDLLSRHPSEAEYQAEPNNDRLIPPDSQETESKPAVATIAASELFTSVVAGQAKVRHIRRTMVMLQLLEGRQEQTAAQQKLTRRFTTYDNLLWRRHPEGDRLVVPRQLVPKVLAYFHDSAEQAHPGYKETLRKIQERYEVLINGRQWNVHVDDLRPAPPGNLEPIPDDDLDYASEGESEEEFEFGEDFRRTNEPPEEPMPSSPPRPESPTPGPSSVLTEEENTALAQIHAIRAQGRNQEPVLGQLNLAPNLQLAAKTVEELTKHMLKLDTVDTRKNLRLRAERKQAIEELENLAQRVEATNATHESVGMPRAPEFSKAPIVEAEPTRFLNPSPIHRTASLEWYNASSSSTLFNFLRTAAWRDLLPPRADD